MRSTFPVVGSLLLVALAPLLEAAPEPRYDVVFAGGRVVDGTGAPWFRADVGVIGDRIAAVGDLSKAQAVRRIDARNSLLRVSNDSARQHVSVGRARQSFVLTPRNRRNVHDETDDAAVEEWTAKLDRMPRDFGRQYP